MGDGGNLERGLASYDEEYFRKEFEGLPRKAMAVVVLRAAMGVLPVLATSNAVIELSEQKSEHPFVRL